MTSIQNLLANDNEDKYNKHEKIIILSEIMMITICNIITHIFFDYTQHNDHYI